MNGIQTLQMGPMGSGMWGFGLVWMLLQLLLVVVVIGGLAYLGLRLVRATEQGRGVGGLGGEDRALSILRERYARGEIDEEEFDRRREQLRRRGGGGG